jgi:outer membrane PBP1 activator LpoA protein
MQRFSSLLAFTSLLIGSLYVSAPACATVDGPVSVSAASAVAPAGSLVPATVAVAPSQPVTPHIALLLPLKSPSFAKAADAVRQGFLAAASKETKALPVRVYPCADESSEIVALYQQALSNGAVAVAGPLTRGGVAALANNPELMTPTLALNMVDGLRTDQLYFFGLPAEIEGRQSAQRATAAGLLSATVVSTNTPLSKRLAQSFSDEWQRSGGILQPEIVYSGDPTPLKELSQEPGNSVFLAAELDKARLLRPYINAVIPVYSTSQVFSGNANTLTNFDLADVRFVDMPWMLQPDHAAVMIYPRSTAPLSADMERLYALGIDAYRLLRILYDRDMTTAMPLDGVTGKISQYGHLFQREGVLAIMRQGQGLPIESKRH